SAGGGGELGGGEGGGEVSEEDEGDVVRHVPAVEEIEEALARHRRDRLLGADDRPAVRVLDVRAGEEELGRDPRRAVLALLDLLKHDLELALELAGVEGRSLNGVGEDVE